MRILLLNQTFYPDVMATAQVLSECAVELASRGSRVTALASKRGYDSLDEAFPAREQWRGIEIRRIGSTRFGKGSKWRRAADFASFLGTCSLRLATLRRHDVVVALTSPPLIAFLGALRARLWRARFVYWVMDLNPDEAVAAGWLDPGSAAGRALEAVSRYCFCMAQRIVALDRFMQDRIVAKGVLQDRVVVVPPWSHDNEVRFDPEGRERFRMAHGLTNQFVVMYSGNHSPCHPLTTLLEAARCLAADDSIRFLFVGGGSEFKRVGEFAQAQGLRNVMQLPYQPLTELAGSLSAADLHTVVMGDAFVGIIHPCKIYNILAVGAPVLYVGPESSHVTDIFGQMQGSEAIASVRHGDVEGLVAAIRRLKTRGARGEPEIYSRVAAQYSSQTLLPQMIAALLPSRSSAKVP